MKNRIASLLMMVTLVAACTTQRPSNSPVASVDDSSMDHSKMNHGSGHEDMASSPGAANAPYELQFLDTMISHHQGAIDMARLAESRAGRSELKSLADNITVSQQDEIDQMRKWRSEWFGDAAPAVNMQFPGMSEGMSEMNMDKLKSLSGTAFDLEFIEQMIPHHKGALVMAGDTADRDTKGKLKSLANQIIADQQKEIEQMEQWRASWQR